MGNRSKLTVCMLALCLAAIVPVWWLSARSSPTQAQLLVELEHDVKGEDMPRLRITITNSSCQSLEFSGIPGAFPGHIMVGNRNGSVMLRNAGTHAALTEELVLNWDGVSLAPRESRIYWQSLSRSITDTRLGKEFRSLDALVLESGSMIVCQMDTKSGVLTSSPLRLP